MKQTITLSDRISPTVFKLPCVASAHKSGLDSRPYCHLLADMMADDDQPLFAHPGDTLIEDDNGKWRVERKSQQNI